MSESALEHLDRNEIRKEVRELCRQFAEYEGRQPRILAGKSKGISEGELHGVCNNLADLGFNVDVAPLTSSTGALAAQSVENDTDILLLMGADKIPSSELRILHKNLVSLKPDTILTLVKPTSLSFNDDSELEDIFCVFDETTETHELALTLMKLLFENNQKL